MSRPVHRASKPYHARIFAVYIAYLKEKESWSDFQIDELLEKLGTSQSRLNHDGSWYDIEFADAFFNLVRQETGNVNIAFESGQYIRKNALSSTIYYLMKGFVSISRLYKLVSKLTPMFTKAGEMKVKELKRSSCIIENIPYHPDLDRQYMCDNRRGMLSGLPQIFNLPPAELNELECIHRGDSRCLYSIRWKDPYLQRQITGLLTTLSLLAAGYFYSFEPKTAVFLLLLSSLLGVLVVLYKKHREQRLEIQLQNEVLEDAVRNIEKKNKELELISQISKLTHRLTTPKEMADTIVRSVCELLQYDRSILLQVNQERQILEVQSHFGYSQELHELLEGAEFNIRPDNTTGFFIKVVNTGAPILIENVPEHIEQLSPRSQKFAKILKSESFVAVPLKDRQGHVLGVLAVEYLNSQRRMSVSDQDLMMMLADHLAIAIYNAKAIEQIEQSLKLARSHSQRQQNLSQVFKKFVPTDVAESLMSNSEKLSSVKKRFVGIMFVDIFGFSTISQNLNPEEVIELLNNFFKQAEPIVSKHAGFIDKFTGDGFMAVFESRTACEDAVKAAAELVQKMPSLNSILDNARLPNIEIGIGLHYGQSILGNVGSDDRLNFTVIGEAVNFAARLESHTRVTGPNTVCCSQVVRNQASHLYAWESLGLIDIKGYKEKFEIFQLIIPNNIKSNRPKVIKLDSKRS